MKLQRGITGFRSNDEPPLPSSNVAGFRSHCYTAARALKGSVVAANACGSGAVSNFVGVVLKLPSESLAVLLNSHFPVIAFAEQMVEGQSVVRFINAPDVTEVFRNFGVYELPDLSELTAPLTAERLSRLAPVEKDQISYWKPQTAGDVIFNFWD